MHAQVRQPPPEVLRLVVEDVAALAQSGEVGYIVVGQVVGAVTCRQRDVGEPGPITAVW